MTIFDHFDDLNPSPNDGETKTLLFRIDKIQLESMSGSKQSSIIPDKEIYVEVEYEYMDMGGGDPISMVDQEDDQSSYAAIGEDEDGNTFYIPNEIMDTILDYAAREFSYITTSGISVEVYGTDDQMLEDLVKLPSGKHRMPGKDM